MSVTRKGKANGGRTVEERRRCLGVSPRELAAVAGCSRSFIVMLESGYQPANSPTLERVVTALELLEEKQRTHPKSDPLNALVADLHRVMRSRRNPGIDQGGDP